MKKSGRCTNLPLFGLLLSLLLAGNASLFADVEEEEKEKPETTKESLGEEDVSENAEKADLDKEEAELKARFDYSIDDVVDKLVVIDCAGPGGKSAGSGFVAKMDGKMYLFTNQHVVFGADRISFKTVDGKILKPRGVELSKSRDIVRLLLSDDVEGFEVSRRVSMGAPVAVFGNSEGGGVATELYGKTMGLGADLVEVSAEFVAGNSGSPVLDSDQRVVGIASYVRFARPSRMSKGTRFENKTRRFCYRLSGCDWIKVDWRSYNKKYGKPFVENEQFVQAVVHVFEQWGEELSGPVEIPSASFRDLKNWAQAHNHLLASERKGTRRYLNKYAESTKRLTRTCAVRANLIRRFSQEGSLTDFLRSESESQIHMLDSVEDGCKYVNTVLCLIQ